MRKNALTIICALICLILLIILIVGLIEKSAYINDCQEIRLHSSYCENLFGLTPKEFCKSKGKGTEIENRYTYAKTDKDGYLILRMTDGQISRWRNSRADVRILQAVLGDKRDIGVKIIEEENPINAVFIEHADTCGYDISEDYQLITISSDDDVFYLSAIASACMFMQITSGIPSDEASVEYVRFDKDGNETNRQTVSYIDANK